MPESVRRTLLPWEWSRDLLWTLDIPSRAVPVTTLRHVFDLPLWRGEDGTPFTVRPADVLREPERFPSHFHRALEADLGYPIHITFWNGGWTVLDGVHRLLKAAYLGKSDIEASVVPPDSYGRFAVGLAVKTPVRAPAAAA